MSCFFDVGNTTLWSPANAVAHLFKGQADAVAAAFNVSSGLGDIVDDLCVIDLPVFEKFVAEASRQYGQATHPILRSLTVSVIATASVLVERADGQLPAVEGEEAAAWARLRREHGRFMSR
jgi:hypothetical protein